MSSVSEKVPASSTPSFTEKNGDGRRKKTVIITPVGNERQNLPDHLLALEYVANKLKADFDDDVLWVPVFTLYSEDGSYRYLHQRIEDKTIPFDVDLLHLGGTSQIAPAYMEGYRHAVEENATFVIEADIGHPVDMIIRLRNALGTKPCAYGTRFNGGSFKDVAWNRRLLSWWGSFAARRLLGIKTTDATSGLMGFQVGVVEEFISYSMLSRGHMIQTEIKAYCADLPYSEIPFEYVGGPSSLKLSAVLSALGVLFSLTSIDKIQEEDFI